MTEDLWLAAVVVLLRRGRVGDLLRYFDSVVTEERGEQR